MEHMAVGLRGHGDIATWSLEDTTHFVACQHVDEHCGHGGLVGAGLCLFKNRTAIKWRTVVGAFALQLGLGAFVLMVPWGQALLSSMTDGVNNLLGYGNAGIDFLFGGLTGEGLDSCSPSRCCQSSCFSPRSLPSFTTWVS